MSIKNRRKILIASSILAACLVVGTSTESCEAVDLASIPSPRPNGWVVDQTGRLTEEDRREINRVCEDVNRTTSGEMAVVVVRSTDGMPTREFAIRLFRKWGVGSASLNNGVLVFVAIEDRKAEIILGDGIDGPREENVSRRSMDRMIQWLKKGNPGQATLVAAEELAAGIYAPSSTLTTKANRPSDAQPDTNTDRTESITPPQAANHFAAAESTQVDAEVDFENDVASATLPEETPDIQPVPNPAGKVWLPIGVGGALLGAGGFVGFRFRRRRPRHCKNCRYPMTLLDEVSDDAHLSDAEQKEEHLGSVDYDVWACQSCGDVMKLRYGAFFSRYSGCPECSARTRSSTTETLQAATEYSTGQVLVTEDCMHCGYHHQETRVTPRIDNSSSSHSSSFSSGGGSGFGGGTTSGGGASGSW